MEDRRNRKTLNLIQTVFIDLLNKKKFSNITVTEICNIADINRGTFYLHYSDINDLIEKIQKEILDNTRNILKFNIKNANSQDSSFLIPILDNIKIYKDFFTALNKENILYCFATDLSKLINQYIVSINNTKLQSTLPDLISYYTAYCSGAIYGIIINWFKNKCSEDSSQIAELIYNLVLYGLKN